MNWCAWLLLLLYFSATICGSLVNGSVDDARTKHILLYTNVTRTARWFFHGADVAGKEYFQNAGCSATNCVLYKNKTYLPSFSDFDAIVMSAAEVSTMYALPPPETRRPNQIYAVNFHEAPDRTPYGYRKLASLFNWTISYTLNGDINMPYGQFVDLETDAVVSPALKPAWRTTNYDDSKTVKSQSVRSIVDGKTKMAAWFVSNCDPPSQRKYLAKKLQQFIQVDVYGKCGTFHCPRNESVCRENMERDYKFYLAFENSLCVDYVTEKVLQTMQKYIIPVVYGGADYNRFLPPGSYINVQDYNSVEDLVEYLQFLSNNTDEYMKYFWWKDYYKIGHPSLCSLCEKLTQLGDNQVVTKSYLDMESWLKNGTCFTPDTVPIVQRAMEEFKGLNLDIL